MEQRKIDRINALARKAKTPEGLTPEEIQERDVLRLEYRRSVLQNLNTQLGSITVLETDGSKHKLKKK